MKDHPLQHSPCRSCSKPLDAASSPTSEHAAPDLREALAEAREALANLESANEVIADLRTQAQYLSMVYAGQSEALSDLDDARHEARAVLAKLGGAQPARAPDLRAALAEAREVLEPFATHAELYDDEPVNMSDDFELGYGVGLMMQKTHAITVGHCRRARRARAKLAKMALTREALHQELPTATGIVVDTGETVRIFQESHDGWATRQTITGEWEIVDRSGWVLATIHYDYRFTSNATNHYRARMLASAPEQAATVARLSAELERCQSDGAQDQQRLFHVEGVVSSLSADLALTREALDRYAAIDPDGACAVLAQMGGEQSENVAPDLRAAFAQAREALMRIDVIIETGKVNHAKVAQKVARAVLAKLAEGA